MITYVLLAVSVGLAVDCIFLSMKLHVANSDYESLLKYDDGLREEIGRLKATIRLKQDSIEGLYDEIESSVCPARVGHGCGLC